MSHAIRSRRPCRRAPHARRGGSRDFPLMPVLILVGIAFVAIFADVLAPHDPEVGSLDRALPSAGLAGRRQRRAPARHRPSGTRRAVAADLRRQGVDGGGLHRGDLRRRHRHHPRHPLRLSGRLGGPGDHAHHRHVAGPAGADLRHLPGGHRRAEQWNIVIILGAVYWTRYARVIRGEVLSLKEREFVRLAIVAGCSKRTIMRRHILPNVVNSAIVLGTLMLGVVIVTEAALSFLGVGVPPPQARLGPDAGRRQEGHDGGLLVAHRAAGRLHHADGALGEPSRGLAPCQTRPTAPSALSRDAAREPAMADRPLLETRQPLDPLRLGAGARGWCARSTTCRCASTPARRSASSASPAPARARWRSPSCACCRRRRGSSAAGCCSRARTCCRSPTPRCATCAASASP